MGPKLRTKFRAWFLIKDKFRALEFCLLFVTADFQNNL